MENQEPERGTLLRGQAAYVPHTPWGPWLAGLAAVLAMGLAAGAAVLAQTLALKTGSAADEGNLLAALGLWQAGTIALTLLAALLFRGRIADVLALRPPAGGGSVYLKAILLMAVMQVGVSVVQHAFFAHDMYADLRPLVRMFGDQWLLALLVVGIGAPLSEELLFRGFLLSALAQSPLGFWGGAIIATTWWTALHAGYTTVGIAEVFLIGLFLSWLLWRTGSLRVPIFCHALYNSLIVVMLRYVPLPAA